MVKVLDALSTKLFKQIRLSWLRFFLIVALGVAMYIAGDQGAWHSDLLHNAWNFYGLALLAVVALAVGILIHINSHDTHKRWVVNVVVLLTLVVSAVAAVLAVVGGVSWAAALLGLAVFAFVFVIALIAAMVKK